MTSLPMYYWENLQGLKFIVRVKVDTLFLDSLIIHRVKTMKITTVTVVWICDVKVARLDFSGTHQPNL